MAAKKGPAFAMSAEHRTKIGNSQILKCLIEHAEGTREMSPSQVTAGLGLLRKVLPDLASVEHSGEVTTKRSSELTDDELAAIAAGSGATAIAATVDPSKLN